VSDFDGNIVVFNDGAQLVFGSDPVNVVGKKTIEDFYPQEFVKSTKFDDIFDQLLADGSCQFELERERSNGKSFIGHSLLTIVHDNEGKLVGFVDITEDITDRRHREEQIRNSEKRYHDILEEMHDSYFEVGISGNLSMTNGSACRILGYSREEFSGMSFNSLIVPKDVKVVEDAFDRVYRTNKPNNGVSFTAVKQNGNLLFAEMSIAPLTNERGWQLGFRCVLRDVTERQEATEIVKKSEKRYRSLFDNMNNGFAYCQMIYEEGYPVDFVYLAANQAFEQQTGLKHVVGKKVSEVIPGIRNSDADLFERYSRVALSGNPEHFETYLEAMKMWLSISVYSLEPGYFVSVFDVITERKEAEKKIKSTLNEKEILIEQLQSALNNIKTLKGLIPICASCKKIRDDQGYWHAVERYVSCRSEAELLSISEMGHFLNRRLLA
jgi:PAS domain S-box-containing protein